MRKNRFFLDIHFESGQDITLDGDVHHQIRHVLRLKPQTEIQLFNGQNEIANASLTDIGKNHSMATLHNVELKNLESPIAIHLGQVIGKGTKMDFVIQKATELGVAEITPLYSEFGMVRYKKEKTEQKLNHWQKIAIAACAQCERNLCPTIHAPMDLQAWLATLEPTSLKIFLDPQSSQSMQQLQSASAIALAIGPEGGFSPKEMQYCRSLGLTGIQMGPRILRTETATLAALSLIQAHLGDFA